MIRPGFADYTRWSNLSEEDKKGGPLWIIRTDEGRSTGVRAPDAMMAVVKFLVQNDYENVISVE